jgi:hypothetical protein
MGIVGTTVDVNHVIANLFEIYYYHKIEEKYVWNS